MAIDKQVNVTIKGKDDLTPTVKKAADTINNNLVKSIQASNLSMRAKEKAIKAVNQQAERNILMVNNIVAGNKTMQKAMGDSATNFQNLVKTLDRVHQGLKIVGQTFVFFVGKEKAFDMINIAAARFANVVQLVANRLKELGGPFAQLVPALNLFRDLLRSGVAGMSAFALIGTTNVESADNLRRSMFGISDGMIDMTDKLRIASIAMSRYGDILLATDGITAKVRGGVYKFGAAVAASAATVIDHVSEMSEEFFLLVGASAALLGFPPAFAIIDKSIVTLTKSLERQSFALQRVQADFNKNFKATSRTMRIMNGLSKTIDDMFKDIGSGIRSFSFNIGGVTTKTREFEKEFITRIRNIRKSVETTANQMSMFGGSVGAARTSMLNLAKIRVQRITAPLTDAFSAFNESASQLFNTTFRVTIPRSIVTGLRAAEPAVNGLGRVIEQLGLTTTATSKVFVRFVTGTLLNFRSAMVIAAAQGQIFEEAMDSLTSKTFKAAIKDFENIKKAALSFGQILGSVALGVQQEFQKFDSLINLIYSPLHSLNILLQQIGIQQFGNVTRSFGTFLATVRDLPFIFGNTTKEFGKMLVQGKALSSSLDALNQTMFRFALSTETSFRNIASSAERNTKIMATAAQQTGDVFRALAAIVLNVANKAFTGLANAVQKSGSMIFLTINRISRSIEGLGTLRVFQRLGANINTLGKDVLKFRQVSVNNFKAIEMATEAAEESVNRFSFSFARAGASAGAAKTNFSTIIKLRIAEFFDAVTQKIILFGEKTVSAAQNVQSSIVRAYRAMTTGEIDFFATRLERAALAMRTFAKDSVEAAQNAFPRVAAAVKSGQAAFMAFAHEVRLNSQNVNNLLGFLVNKTQNAMLKFSMFITEGAINGLGSLRTLLTNTHVALRAFISQAKLSAAVGGNLGSALLEAAKHTEFFEKGMAATVARIGVLSSGFGALGLALTKSDSTMEKMAGVTLIALSAAMGGLTFLVQQAIVAVGGLIQKLGTGLTNASMKQIELFSKGQEKTFAFTQTLKGYSKSADEAAAATERWNSFIEETSKATGATTFSLQALVAETVGATKELGLNEQQMQKLIARSVDLSERAHRPAIDTLTALINAMNGNTAGLAIYGLHLNQVAIDHSNLNEELKKNFKNLNDTEKAMARYSVLMEQAGKATGFATENAFTYSKSLKLQENALKTLNAELGRGAEIINGRVVFGLAEATRLFTNMAKPLLPLIGFFQALGGRVLQITGFLISHALTIGLVTSSYRALQTLLGKLSNDGFFFKTLPFIDKSLYDIAESAGATTVNFSSLGGIARTTFSALRTQIALTIKQMLGLRAATELTAKSFSTGLRIRGRQAARAILDIGMGTQVTAGLLVSKLGSALASVTKKVLFMDAAAKLTTRTVGTQLVRGLILAAGAAKGLVVALLPIIAKAALIAAAVYVVYKAFVILDERTKIFTKTYAALVKWWKESSPIVEFLKDTMEDFAEVMGKILVASAKALAAALSLMFASILLVIKGWMELSTVLRLINPSWGASEQSIAKIDAKLKLLAGTAKTLAAESLMDFANVMIDTSVASDKASSSYEAALKKIQKLSEAYEEVKKKGQEAMDFGSDYSPELQLIKLQTEARKAVKDLDEMKSKANEIQSALFKLGGTPLTPSQLGQLSELQADIKESELALKGIRLKIAQEERQSKLDIVELENQQRYNEAVSTAAEIRTARIQSELDLRDRLVEIATETELQKRGIATASGATIQEEALIAANQREIELFQQKMEAQKQIAISVEEQKQNIINQMRSDITGQQGGGGGGDQLQAINQREQQKLELLQRYREREIITQQQYEQDMLAVMQSGAEERLELERSILNQRQQLLGLTPEGTQARLALAQQEHMMRMEQLNTQREELRLSDEEFRAAQMEAEMSFEERKQQIKERGLQNEISRHEKMGNSWKASLARMRLEQERHGKILGTIRGIQASAEFQAVQGSLNNLASLRNSKDRRMFQIGKTAAIAQTMVSTFMGATQAYAALSGIPFVGPALGAAAAAAAVAAGMMNVQQIKSQKFQGGGQADQGIDSIPKSLSGKSFILSAGERVVQPEANKDLTNFLSNVSDGGMGGHTVNITVQGNASADTVEEIKRAVIEGIREASERGEPIMNERGIVREA